MISKETEKMFQGTQLWIDGEMILQIVADKRLRHNTIRILLMIASRDWGGKSGVCKMSTNDFAEILEINRASAQKIIRDLQKFGYIQQIYRVKMVDGKVKATTSWKQAALLNKSGAILRSYFRISKHGIRAGTKKSKHKK